MKFRNVKTGNVIDVSGSISGKDWQAVAPAKKPETEKAAPATKKKSTKESKE